jgi:SRSO17 transposase
MSPATVPVSVADPCIAEQFALTEVASWAADLSTLVARLAPHFARAEPRRRVLAYLQGLLSPLERKNGWQVAEAAGEATPYAMQHLLNGADWDADAVRDDLRAYVVEQLGDADAVLVVDETGFLKKGTKSVGVQRQSSGTAGRIENCQVGVFLAYASARGHAFLDRALYLPHSWTDDPARCQAAGVPADVAFATKPALAQAMLARARTAGVGVAWVTADELYGRNTALRQDLEAHGQAYVLAVRTQDQVIADPAAGRVTGPAVVAGLGDDAWQRLSCGDGAKGRRWYDWALVPLTSPDTPSGWARWLLVRRGVGEHPELAYYLVSAPAATPLTEVVRVAGTRWTVETAFEEAKGAVGLDQYEVRKWVAWHRHITLALLAHAYLAATRAATGAVAPLLPTIPAPSPDWQRFRQARGLAPG